MPKNTLLNLSDISSLLKVNGEEFDKLLASAKQLRDEKLGNQIYLRGLIEFSNVCSKDCYYCGIRKSNKQVQRYNVSDDEVLASCRLAFDNGLGSVVLQSGECSSPAFVTRVDRLLKKIKQLSGNRLGITLSCGEQSPETYRRWFESGAHRYLLRIETSNRDLYYKIHPNDKKHSFEHRLEALYYLKYTGYQTGSGVMIGLPFQTTEHLAGDLLFFKNIDIDMCGMGPYVEHENTPLEGCRHLLRPKKERFELALKMIAVLRLMMYDINIAASTALDAIDVFGRVKAVAAGANVVMPNITPAKYRSNYLLYENKPIGNNDVLADIALLEQRIKVIGNEIGYNQWGDAKHFFKKNER